MLCFSARFFDGKKAHSKKVKVSKVSNGLQMQIENDAKIIEWAFDDLILMDKSIEGRPVILSSEQDPNARLLITEQQWQEIEGRQGGSQKNFQYNLQHNSKDNSRHNLQDNSQHNIQHNFKHHSQYKKNTFRVFNLKFVLPILFLLAVLSGIIFLPNCSKTIAGFVPNSMEDFIASMAEKELDLAEKKVGSNRQKIILNKIVDHLQISNNLSRKINIEIVDMGSANAISLPNRIYIDRLLLGESQSESELMGIIAHEMGHILKKHSLMHIIQHLGISFFVTHALGINHKFNFLFVNHYSQALEIEADAVAADILYNARVGTQGLQNFFKRQGREGKLQKMLTILSTHPTSIERLNGLQNMKEPQRIEQLLTKEEWQALKAPSP